MYFKLLKGNNNPLICTGNVLFDFVFQGDLVAAGILSGNRNFEGRVHPNTRANYLASPLLVIAYAIAGTVRIDFEKEPVGMILKILTTIPGLGGNKYFRWGCAIFQCNTNGRIRVHCEMAII